MLRVVSVWGEKGGEWRRLASLIVAIRDHARVVLGHAAKSRHTTMWLIAASVAAASNVEALSLMQIARTHMAPLSMFLSRHFAPIIIAVGGDGGGGGGDIHIIHLQLY